jgi:hypothetical protein
MQISMHDSQQRELAFRLIDDGEVLARNHLTTDYSTSNHNA